MMRRQDAQDAVDATQDAQDVGDATQEAQDVGDATQDAQDAQDAGDADSTSRPSGCNAAASDTGYFFADVTLTRYDIPFVYYERML